MPMTGHEAIAEAGGPWKDGDGNRVFKENVVIAGIVLDDSTDSFTASYLDSAIENIADVHTDKTIESYREEVIEHGPFEQTGIGRWAVVEGNNADE